MTVAAVVATVAAVISAFFAFRSFRESRRIHPRVGWTVDMTRSGADYVVKVKNIGTGTARGVTIERSPTPRSIRGPDGATPQDVAAGGTVILAHTRLLAEPETDRVTVRRRRLLFLTEKWSTSV